MKGGEVFVPFGISVESCIDWNVLSEHLHQPFHLYVPPEISRAYVLSQAPQDLANIRFIFLFSVCTVNVTKAMGGSAGYGWLKPCLIL